MHEYANVVKSITCLATVAVLIGGCAVESSSPTHSAPRAEAPAQRTAQTKVDPAQGERIKRIMVPLIAAMDKPRDLKQIKVGIMDDPSINAANAGNGEFFVTTGLLQKANDAQLTAILAHEVAHEDLGHVAKAQALGAGLNIGMVILDQLIPGSGAVTPIAGDARRAGVQPQGGVCGGQAWCRDPRAHGTVEAAHDRHADMADAGGGIGQRRLLRDASRDRRPDRRAQEASALSRDGVARRSQTARPSR